jgi:large subunit ribosomal protein L13
MKTANKSYLPTGTDSQRKQWFVVDASEKVLGKLAVRIATILTGKHKPTYTPHIDMGDFVVVLNAGKVKVTGAKRDEVVYQNYSGYPSGLKITPMREMLNRHPDRVLREAVRRMMPKNALASRMLLKLKTYEGDTHPHQAQMPEPLKF